MRTDLLYFNLNYLQRIMERFCTQSIKIPFPIKIFYGSEVIVTLPKIADAITRIRVVLDFSSSVNTLGETIVNEAELFAKDGNSIEKLYGEFVKIENQFVTPIEKKTLLSELLCTTTQGTMYLDLPFHALRPRFFEYDSVRLLFATDNSNGNELEGHLLVDYIVTNGLPKEPYFQKTRKISKLTVPVQRLTKILNIDSYVPGSVYEIWITIKDPDTGEYVSNALESVKLLIKGNERFNLGEQYLRYIMPVKLYGRVPQDIPVYMYSFRLKNDDTVPSGQTNLTDTQRFVLTFLNNNSEYVVNVWIQSHDFFYKAKGELPAKQVFNSDELVISSSSGSFIKDGDFLPVPLKTSYTFYVDTASVKYSCDVEISNVHVVSTNAPDYTITQNQIIFKNIDSATGEYYANVVFSAYGFEDVTCYYNFKSPKSVYYDANASQIGFYDVLHTGNPRFFIDGDQRFNASYGTSLNGVNLGGTSILSVNTDQYRNYIVNRDSSVTKYSSSFSTTLYTLNGDYFGKPSSYFERDVIPASNIVYTYNTNSLVGTNTVNYCKFHESVIEESGNVYVSGTTFDSNPIVFDGNVTVATGSGTKSVLVKYSPSFAFCVVADQNTGPTSVSLSSSGPVFMFPVTSSTQLYATDATYSYAGDGISVVQLDLSGKRKWGYTVSASGLTMGTCRTDDFDNTYFTYSDSTNFYVRKLSISGSLKWTRTFSKLSMNVFYSQDTLLVSYLNSTGSNALLTTDARKFNVPSGFTGIDVLDSDGNLIEYYDTPTSNVTDFTNRIENVYSNPLYSGEYFSNAYDFTYTKTYRNYWGVFINGVPSDATRAVDSLSDTVFTGQYGPGSSNIYPTSIVLPSVDRAAAFVTKIDSSGNVKWASYIDNVLNTYYEYSVNITATGNVYASGTYGAYTSNIYNSDGTKFAGSLPVLGDNGVYLVKFDTDGFAVWQTYINGVGGDDRNYNITRKHSNVYIVGNRFSGSSITVYDAKLTGDRVPVSSGRTTSNQCFIVKYNNNGTSQWLTSVPLAQPNDITIDSNENIVTCFNYYGGGSSQFVQSDGTNFSPVLSQRAVLRITPNGFGSLGFYMQNAHEMVCVAVNPSDDSIVACGRFRPPSDGGITFYQWDGSAIVNSGATLNPPRGLGADAYIAKYNSAGVFQWRAYIVHATTAGGSGDIVPNSCICDSAGNVYVSGWYENNTDVSVVYSSNDVAFSKVLPGLSSSTAFGDNFRGGYLVKYNSSGICQWVVKIELQSSIIGGTELYTGVAVDSGGNIVVSGSYTGKNVKFYDSNDGEHTSFQPVSSSGIIAYCVKYDTNGFLVPL